MGQTEPLSRLDQLLALAGRALATIAAAAPPGKASPAAVVPEQQLAEPDRQLSGALMRVNHVGEVCAQALYEGQALTARAPALAQHFREAAAQEADHLAWTRQRLQELGSQPSLLNPLWFAGAFALGAIAGRLGDRASLSFMAQTEAQVEQHLAGHLDRLPAADLRSRALVRAMRDDEIAHAQGAWRLGAAQMHPAAQAAMRLAARVMTVTVHRF